MSWDATLYDDRGHVEGEWNFTHNTNGMINDVVDLELRNQARCSKALAIGRHDLVERIDKGEIRGSWWDVLDGMSGKDGIRFLSAIIEALEEDPEHFRSMNPSNGWGDYDSLVAVLKSMRDATPTDWPTEWNVWG